ncbi:MAG: hypothetical protein IKF64_07030, partial [Eubacterium sp.]|nr:hypothetical protein [Eubacterium sp.]
GGELLAVGKKACISFDNGITWMKSKSKFAPIKAIANGEKFMTSINTKSGTVLVGGEFEYKKNKYKGVEYSEDTLSIAGGLFPCTDIKVFGGKYATIYITPDNKEVSFDIM